MQAIDNFDYCPFMDQTRRVWDAVSGVAEALDKILVHPPSVALRAHSGKAKKGVVRPQKIYYPTRPAHALFAVAAGFERVGSMLLTMCFSDAAARIAVTKLDRLYYVMTAVDLDVSVLPSLKVARDCLAPASDTMFAALLVVAFAVNNLAKQVASMYGSLGLVPSRGPDPPRPHPNHAAVPERMLGASATMEVSRSLVADGDTRVM